MPGPAGQWLNADGIKVRFGQAYQGSPERVNQPSILSTYGTEKEIFIPVDLTKIPAGTTSFSSDLNNDGTLDGFTQGDVYLPANSSVLSAIFVSTETAVGGTSFTVGHYLANGTAVSATSLVTATEGVTANLTLGKRVYGAGALVATTAGTGGTGASTSYIGITTAGTFTAGKGYLRVRYIGQTV